MSKISLVMNKPELFHKNSYWCLIHYKGFSTPWSIWDQQVFYTTILADFLVYPSPTSLDSPVIKTPGSLDSTVVNTLGSLDSTVVNTTPWWWIHHSFFTYTNNSRNIRQKLIFCVGVSNGTRRNCLVKKNEDEKSLVSLSLWIFHIRSSLDLFS